MGQPGWVCRFAVSIATRQGLQRLPSLQRFPHRRLIGPLVTLENRLWLLPPAQVTQVFQRGVLQLRREFSAEAVPAEPRLMINLRQFLAALPPVPNQELWCPIPGPSVAACYSCPRLFTRSRRRPAYASRG